MWRVSMLWSGAVSSRIKGEESLFLSIRYTCTNINAIAKSRLAQSAVAEDHSLGECTQRYFPLGRHFPSLSCRRKRVPVYSLTSTWDV